MQSQVDADSMRSMFLFFAALVALVTAVLNILNARVQAAKTEEEKQTVYYSALRWVETGIWAAGTVASMFFGLGAAMLFFIPAYILGCATFLKSRSPYLRADILQLVIGTGALVLFASMYWIRELTDQVGLLTENMTKLVNTLGGK
jgi:hypothetical protein